jgi:hypothetical protein
MMMIYNIKLKLNMYTIYKFFIVKKEKKSNADLQIGLLPSS